MNARCFRGVARIIFGVLLAGGLIAGAPTLARAGQANNNAPPPLDVVPLNEGGLPNNGAEGGYGGGAPPGDDPFSPGGFDPSDYDDPPGGFGDDPNSLGGAGTDEEEEPSGGSAEFTEYLALLAPGEDPAILPGFGARLERSFFMDLFGRFVHVVALDSDPLVRDLSILEMELSPQVEVIQPNYSYSLSSGAAPLAPLAPLNSDASTARSAASQTATGGAVVALIDTAVEVSHPALSHAAITRFDHQGQPSDEPGGVHGTAMASLIVGRAPVDGADAPARVYSYSAFKVDAANPNVGRSSSELVLQAVNAAGLAGVDVLSMSFEKSKRELLLSMALGAITSSGVVAVAAAGNGGPSAPPAYPAAYDSVLAISAVDKAGNLYSHANRGDYIFAAALGVEVKVATPGAGYAVKSGTSMAAAYFAGLVARLITARPDLGGSEIAELLIAAAEDSGAPGRDRDFGHGRVELDRFLAAVNGG